MPNINIRKSLLQFVFSGSYMKRWNDKLRPMELMEVDKQAHKMMAAWLLFVLNSRGLPDEERLALGGQIIEGGLFEYFYRLVITDIKPPVFYQIKANPDHYDRLTEWVLEQLMPRIRPLGGAFWKRLCAYLKEPEHTDLAGQILTASHLYASNWEFNLIKGINPLDDEFADIEQWFKTGLGNFSHLRGVPEIMEGPKTPLGRFMHQCGQLRFQTRWSQTPRIPETSVLGHLFVVACYSYFFSLAVGACEARSQNNFFAGLFHDLPEFLTRDIISPVKRSVARIGDLIKEYEGLQMESRVFSLLRQGGANDVAERLAYFLGIEVGSEFASTVVERGEIREVDWDKLRERYNENGFDPKDGEMLKICDDMAAFLEAYTAVRNGITSDHLQGAMWRIRKMYAHTSAVNGLHMGALLADFD